MIGVRILVRSIHQRLHFDGRRSGELTDAECNSLFQALK